jgi:hypothetical protein
MAFSIKFVEAVSLSTARGLLTLGDFQEELDIPLVFWNESNYKLQWKQALIRITSECYADSCLITAMYDPELANFIVWWPMYKSKSTVYIQNQMLFMKDLSEKFVPEDLYSFINARRTISDNGEPISEWSVEVDEIKTFLSSMY